MILAFASQKGGVAKSSTAAAWAAGLHKMGARTLLIDIDPQCSLSLICGGNIPRQGRTVFDILMGIQPASECIVTTESFGDFIPSLPLLAGADAKITGEGRSKRLSSALAPIRRRYDYIIIDTPPALGVLTINALTAADRLIIPVLADIMSVQALRCFRETIDVVKEHSNPELIISGVLITRHNARSILSRDMAEVIGSTASTQLNVAVFKTAIRECVALREAQALQKSIFEYAPRSNGAADYMAAIEEFTEREKANYEKE